MTEFNQNDRVRIARAHEKDPDDNLGLVGLTGRVELVPPTELTETPDDAYYFVPDDPSRIPGLYRAMFGSATIPVQGRYLELITDSEEDAA